MSSLIGILDTEMNKNRVEFDGNFDKDNAIVRKLENNLREGTFRDLIGYLTTNTDEDEKPIAEEVNRYLQEHNGNTVICEVKACDAEGNYIPGTKNSQVIDLDEKIGPYISKRNVEGEEFDCIEMVLGQLTAVG